MQGSGENRRLRRGEEGSALLIVFVFAAVIAIMLYKQLPDAMFEAERAKEQVLIDRGSEYKLAIKRFYIRNRTYPTSIDQLENFNNIRYLRRRYKDPLTGKDEWRVIHIMTPGFVLTDSKVTPLKKNNGQSNSAFGGGFASNQTGPFGQSNSNSAFGNSNTNTSTGGFGSTANSAFGNSNSSAFSNSGAGNNLSSDNPWNNSDNGNAQSGTDPNAPHVPTAAELYGARRRPSPAPAPQGGEGQQNSPDQDPNDPSQNQNNDTSQDNDPMNVQSNPFQNGPGTGPAGNAQQGAAVAAAANGTTPSQQAAANANAGANAGAAADPSHPSNATMMNAVNGALRQGMAIPGGTASQTSGTQSTMGTISSGGIAGVASKAEGSTIKVYDKQTDFSKWEFVYNPQKEDEQRLRGAMNGGRTNQNGTNPFGTGSSSFNNGSSGFGSSNTAGFGSPSGSSSSNTSANQ